MKQSTLIIILLVVAAGAGYYFYQQKQKAAAAPAPAAPNVITERGGVQTPTVGQMSTRSKAASMVLV